MLKVCKSAYKLSFNRKSIIIFLTILLHKRRTLDPKTVSAETVLEMATINGAKCALMEKEKELLEKIKEAVANL